MPDLSALDLARAQFALTAGLHFLLVATTLGVAPLLAVLQSAAALRRDPLRRAGLEQARDALLRPYLINYGAGIVTGLILELQMGLNWSHVTAGLYDPIATTLASETLLASLLESTLLGLSIALSRSGQCAPVASEASAPDGRPSNTLAAGTHKHAKSSQMVKVGKRRPNGPSVLPQ